jgi:uncharacterized protein
MFKQKDFGGGLVAGVQAIAEHLRAAQGEGTSDQPPHEYRDNGAVVVPDTGSGAGRPATVPPTVPPDPTSYVVTSDEGGDPGSSGTPVGALVAGGLGLVGAGGAFAFARRRKRQRTCESCKPPRAMLMLDEIEDDKHLEQGQIAEEQVGSVDYEVLVCPGCQASRTLPHRKWFSRYKQCSSCGYRTMQSSSSTVVEATYSHGGQIEVTETCVGCNKVNTYTRYTAVRTLQSASDTSYGSSSSSSSSSSSGGGGGGFSGGSSSGGGAGSSW